jgi:hypothetical protein
VIVTESKIDSFTSFVKEAEPRLRRARGRDPRPAGNKTPDPRLTFRRTPNAHDHSLFDDLGYLDRRHNVVEVPGVLPNLSLHVKHQRRPPS